MTADGDDPILDACLEEVLGGHTPPDQARNPHSLVEHGRQEPHMEGAGMSADHSWTRRPTTGPLLRESAEAVDVINFSVAHTNDPSHDGSLASARSSYPRDWHRCRICAAISPLGHPHSR